MLPPDEQPDAIQSDSPQSAWQAGSLDLKFMPAPKKIQKPLPEEIVLRLLIRSLQDAQKSPRPEVAEVAYNYEKHFQTKLHKLLAARKT